MEELLELSLLLRVINANLFHLSLHLVHNAVSVGFLLLEEFVVQLIPPSIGRCQVLDLRIYNGRNQDLGEVSLGLRVVPIPTLRVHCQELMLPVPRVLILILGLRCLFYFNVYNALACACLLIILFEVDVGEQARRYKTVFLLLLCYSLIQYLTGVLVDRRITAFRTPLICSQY